MEKHGIKETLEVLDFANLLAVKMIAALKDGAQLDDLKLLLDAELHAKGKAALDGFAIVKEELKDVSLDEAPELALKGIKMAKDVLEALKK